MQSVVEPLDEVGVTAAVNRQALGHPFVHTADGRLVLAPLGTGTDDFLEGLARHQQVGRGLIVVAVLLVAEGQTVVLIVDDEGLADGFDGRAQHGLAGLQLLLDDRPGDEGAVQHQQQHNDDQGAASAEHQDHLPIMHIRQQSPLYRTPDIDGQIVLRQTVEPVNALDAIDLADPDVGTGLGRIGL